MGWFALRRLKRVSSDLFFFPPEIPADEDPDAAAEAILATEFLKLATLYVST